MCARNGFFRDQTFVNAGLLARLFEFRPAIYTRYPGHHGVFIRLTCPRVIDSFPRKRSTMAAAKDCAETKKIKNDAHSPTCTKINSTKTFAGLPVNVASVIQYLRQRVSSVAAGLAWLEVKYYYRKKKRKCTLLYMCIGGSSCWAVVVVIILEAGDPILLCSDKKTYAWRFAVYLLLNMFLFYSTWNELVSFILSVYSTTLCALISHTHNSNIL